MNLKAQFLTFILTLSVLGATKLRSQKADVNVEMNKDIERLVNLRIETNREAFNREYFIIQLGFGTLKKMQQLEAEFLQTFPYINTEIRFETPNYKLQVGRDKSRIRVEKLLREIKFEFPTSFIIQRK